MAASSRRVDAASRERSEAPPKPESRRGEAGERRGSWRGGKRRASGRRRAGRRANGRRGAAARVTIARRARTESTAVPVSLAVLHEPVGEVAIRSEVRRGGRHGRPASVTFRLVPPLLGTLVRDPGTASEPGNGRASDARVWTLGLRASCATVRCRQWRRALVGGGWRPVRARGSARVLFSPAWVLFEARFHRSSPPNEDFEATAWGPVPSDPRAVSPRAARVPPSTVRISRFPRRISSLFESSATPRRRTPAERASRAGLFALEKAPSADDRQQRLKTARGSRRHERDGRRRRPRHRGRGEGVGRGP